MNFYTADHHFFQQRAIRRFNRPFHDTTEMNARMVFQWQNYVDHMDTVYFLGDLSVGTKLMTQHILEQLPGRKIMIRGNHDLGRPHSFWKRLGFSDSFDELIMPIGDRVCQLIHRPIPLRNFPDGIDVVICGHIHNLRKAPPRNICVSVELFDYTPVAEPDLIKLIRAVKRNYTYSN